MNKERLIKYLILSHRIISKMEDNLSEMKEVYDEYFRRLSKKVDVDRIDFDAIMDSEVPSFGKDITEEDVKHILFWGYKKE